MTLPPRHTSSGSVPDSARRCDELLRYAGNRLVRHDYGGIQAQEYGARPRHPRHAERGTHPADDPSGVPVHGAIPVDVLTLFAMIVAAVLGAWLGAASSRNGRSERSRSGWGLPCWRPPCSFSCDSSTCSPAGSDEIGVRGIKFLIAVGGNFMLGALMTLGIGL